MRDDEEFGPALARLRGERGLSLRALAQRVHYSRSHLSDVEHGRRQVTLDLAAACDEALDARGALRRRIERARPPDGDEELDAYELSRRIAATDVGSSTVEMLTAATDDLAVAYPVTAPEELAAGIARHLRYVERLLTRRATLRQHRRLVVAGGWLSLLGATVAIDVRRRSVGAARLRVAELAAREAGDAEMSAWCLETRAWDAVTVGEYDAAVRLSRAAQRVAPAGGSARAQAVGQEGRSWARLGDRRRTRDALDRVHMLAARLPAPVRPGHHYRYDPTKLTAYTATTLAWSGDPAAELPARALITELEGQQQDAERPGRMSSSRSAQPASGTSTPGLRREPTAHWPRRLASARLDLALALTAAGQPEEAADQALRSIRSGHVVPSNHWRAEEVVVAVGSTGVPGSVELRDAYRQCCRHGPVTR